MKSTSLTALAALGLVAISVTVAHAAPILTGYDVYDTPGSGFGGWYNYYNGTITPDGSLYDYTGYASGTLNDGIDGTGPNNTQLFETSDDATIYGVLNGSYDLTNITLFQFNNNNYIPGVITGADVTIDGDTQYITASAPDGQNTQVLNLVGSGLDLLSTDSFELSGVTVNTGAEFGDDYYSISEIELNGSPNSNSVPDSASSCALLAAGLLVLGCYRKRLVTA
jgi:hypothetical protein